MYILLDAWPTQILTLRTLVRCFVERFAVRDLTRLRMMSTSCDQTVLKCAREVSLPVPWGQIAGKSWGNPDGKPVLALHGWLDNAGSFDKLIPLLSKDLNIVAIDWPGHGHSSHRSKGSHYHVYDYIADIKYVVDALKWDKFRILAHSMGSLPGRVDGLVLLEGFGFWVKPMTDLPELMGHALNSLSLLEDQDPKTYPSWDAIVARMLEGHTRSDRDFTLEAAATLSIRGARQVEEGGYQFTRDLKVKAPSLLKICPEVNDTFLEGIKCPILVVIGNKTFFPTNILNKWLQMKKIKVVKVEGGHHVHLYNPEVMNRLVEQFLLTNTIHPDYQEMSKL